MTHMLPPLPVINFMTLNQRRSSSPSLRDGGSFSHATATTTASVWNYTHWDTLQDSTGRPRGANPGIYSFMSHLVKCDSILVAEPEFPVASPFLGKVMETCKVSSGMFKKKRPVGAGMGEGGVK